MLTHRWRRLSASPGFRSTCGHGSTFQTWPWPSLQGLCSHRLQASVRGERGDVREGEQSSESLPTAGTTRALPPSSTMRTPELVVSAVAAARAEVLQTAARRVGSNVWWCQLGSCSASHRQHPCQARMHAPPHSHRHVALCAGGPAQMARACAQRSGGSVTNAALWTPTRAAHASRRHAAPPMLPFPASLQAARTLKVTVMMAGFARNAVKRVGRRPQEGLRATQRKGPLCDCNLPPPLAAPAG